MEKTQPPVVVGPPNQLIARNPAESLYQAFKAHKIEKVNMILKDYGSADISDATDIMNLMRRIVQTQPQSKHLTPLEAALRLGNYNICKLLIDEGAIKFPANKNKNLLRHAFEGGNFKIAKLLVNAGANVWMEYEGMLPLFFALNDKNCSEDLVKSIIEVGFPPNQIINKMLNQTALHVAVMMNHISIVEYLLSELKVDPNVQDTSGRTPLHYASSKNFDMITEMLVIYGARIDIECHNNFTPLFYMIAHGNLSTVKQLLSLGSNIHHASGQTSSLTPLHLATLLGQLTVVKELLVREAEVDRRITETGETALHSAARVQSPNSQTKISIDCIVQLLLEEKADLSLRDEFGWTPLQVAARADNVSLAKSLIHNGSPLNEAVEIDGVITVSQTPFHTIAETRSKELIVACLEYGGDCLKKTGDGLNPAQVSMVALLSHEINCCDNDCKKASRKDCSSIFRHFVKYRIPVQLLTRLNFLLGTSPPYPGEIRNIMSSQMELSISIKRNLPKLFKQAIKAGADVRGCSEELPFPVHFMAAEGRVWMLSKFLSRGANINVVNKDGKTPLHLAAEAGHYECCVMLLEHGAVFNPKSSKCTRTPVQLANENKHRKIRKLLQAIARHFKYMEKGHFGTAHLGTDNFLPMLNSFNRKGQSLLSIAVENNFKATARKVMNTKLILREISKKQFKDFKVLA